MGGRGEGGGKERARIYTIRQSRARQHGDYYHAKKHTVLPVRLSVALQYARGRNIVKAMMLGFS